MSLGPIQSYVIENKVDADYYLNDLLKQPQYRSMDEVNLRAQKYIKDTQVKNYFINKATEILRSYGVS